jgi:hypothetical protein
MLVSQEAHRSKLICFLFVPVVCFLVEVVTRVEEGAGETLVEI